VDSNSGHVNSTGSNVKESILTDAVAQKPEGSMDAEDGKQDTVIAGGDSRNVTVEASFEDLDGTTEHFVLVEAEAGWTIDYSYTAAGQKEPVTGSIDANSADLYYVDGKAYVKIPVQPGSDGKVSMDLDLTAPRGSVHEGKYSTEILAGSTDKDTKDGELTFHNNSATAEFGDVSGTVNNGGGTGPYWFEQNSALYEDNMPHYNEGNTAVEGGGFTISSPACAGGYVLIESDDVVVLVGGEKAEYDSELGGWLIPLDENGKPGGAVEMILSDEYLQNHPNSDADITLDGVTFLNGDKEAQYSVPDSQLDVVVDAVADWTDVSTESPDVNDQADVVGAKGGDVTFTVKADFADDSERHYILVEKTPTWSLDESSLPEGAVVTEVYIDGTMYYSIEVTNAPDYDGSLSVTMDYTGSNGDLVKVELDADGNPPSGSILIGGTYYTVSDDGLHTYDVKVGTMTKEGELTGDETDLQNNISVNIADEPVELYYSPVDTDASFSLDSRIDEGGVINLDFSGVEIDKADKLNDISVTFTQQNSNGGDGEVIGSLTISYTDVDGVVQTRVVEIKSSESFSDFTANELAALESGDCTMTFRPQDASGNTHNHNDITVSWNGTVVDRLSGEEASFNGGKKVVVNAVADGVSNADAADFISATAVENGQNSFVSIKAEFIDKGDASTEQHWVVLEQKDMEYDVVGVTVRDANGPVEGDWTIVTKFDSNGKPYFAVQLPNDGTDYEVVFEVTTPSYENDHTFTLKGGAITVEPQKDDASGNREPDYSDNWDEAITTVDITTGIVETKAADVVMTIADGVEDGYSAVSFTLPKDFNVNGKYNESVTIKITESPNGSFYELVDGQYVPVTELDGEKAANGDYYFKGNADWSGETSIKYEVEVTDKASGA
ncbi:hypothetical protein LJC23_07590, partial [Desulfovibrio sp. OttesenSCG-928-I05]|nr:hypothetical protein [Desulfovibrio sp. OttesenSCG-928-I05]